MEKKCKYIEEIEKKLKMWKLVGVSIILIVIGVCLIVTNWNHIQYLFYDENREFSYSIFWTAMGAIIAFLASTGVIITILYSEKSRIKQNKFTYMENQLGDEQREFKKEVKEQLKILDFLNVASIMCELVNENNYYDVCKKLDEYNFKIKGIDYQILWYYNCTIYGNYMALNEFITELNFSIEYITKQITNYQNVVMKFGNLNLWKKYKDIEKYIIDDKIKQETEKFVSKIQNEDSYRMEIQDERNKICKEIVDYRNARWNFIVEKAKLMIEERNQLMKNKLNEIEKEGK